MKELKEFTVERLSEIAMDAYEADLSNDEMQALAKIALAAKQVRPTFDEWLSSLDGTIEVDCGCVTTEAFYHWIRVAYDATPPLNHTDQHMAVPDGWIKCSDRLPEEGGRYLAWFNQQNSLGLSSWAENIGYHPDAVGFRVNGKVTHWMKLPAAPKPESE